MSLAWETEFRSQLAIKLCSSLELQQLAIEQLTSQLPLDLLDALPQSKESIVFRWVVVNGFKCPCLGVIYRYDARLVREEYKPHRDKFCKLVHDLLGFRRVLFSGTDGTTLAIWDEEEWILESLEKLEGQFD